MSSCDKVTSNDILTTDMQRLFLQAVNSASSVNAKAATTLEQYTCVTINRAAVSRHDLSRQLFLSRTSSWSFPEGADYPTYFVYIIHIV